MKEGIIAMLYLSYNETRSGGEVCTGDENKAWPCYEDTFIEWTPINIYKNMEDCRKEGHYTEKVSVPFEAIINQQIWLVVVRYTDGDTFGFIRGMWHIVGVYADEESATKEANSILDGSYSNEYKPWEGYFASFEGVNIYPMQVK